MFGHEYNRVKKIRDKITKRYEARLARMNEDIHIMDIFVYAKSVNQIYGEYDQRKTKDEYDHVVERLFDHIELLANIANIYHQQYYCQLSEDGKSYVLNPQCRNKITRLALSEFSLFAHRPLTLKEFSLLAEAVHKMAANLHPNVHLLLSTMAVITEDNTILNMSLHVQCGKDAKVTPFCKGSPHPGDIIYSGTAFKNPGASEYITNMSTQVSNNTIIRVKTEGGAEYVQAVDVCLDHCDRRSRELLHKAISRDAAHDHSLVPDQIDHLITSNSVYISKQITTAVPVQVDPRERISNHMFQDSVNVEALRAAGKNKYDKMRVEKDETGISISNPSFGGDIRIVACGERKLGGFSPDLRDACKQRNTAVVNQAVKGHVSDDEMLHQFKFINMQAQQMMMRVNALQRALLVKCSDKYLQKLFNTNESKLKVRIRGVMTDHFSEIATLTDDEITFVDRVDKILDELKSNIVKACDNIEYDFCKEMVSMIDRAADSINTIKSSINLKR